MRDTEFECMQHGWRSDTEVCRFCMALVIAEDKLKEKTAEDTIFNRDPKTHQLVALKDNQIPMRHDSGVEFMAELVPLDGSVQINYAFDPHAEISEEQKQQIVAESNIFFNEMFQDIPPSALFETMEMLDD